MNHFDSEIETIDDVAVEALLAQARATVLHIDQILSQPLVDVSVQSHYVTVDADFFRILADAKAAVSSGR